MHKSAVPSMVLQYMDDGKRSAVIRALSLIMELGPSLGLLVNIGKSELFCMNDVSMFLKALQFLQCHILALIGDYTFC